MNRNIGNRLFTGLFIIGIGVFFLLRQLGYVDISLGELFSTFWPVILIFFGLNQLLAGGWWGMILLVVGGTFLGNNLDLFDWSIGDIVPYLIPFVIIVVGLRMIWRPQRNKKSPPSDDWKSYRPFEAEHANVPPAPPLHPDPTGVMGEEAAPPPPRPDAPYGSEHTQESDSEPMYDKKKRKSSCDGRYSHNEHVEWWNHKDSNVQNRSNFIGDIHMGHDYWELKPLNISHFIGDTVLDLTKAEIPFGETKICISSFIGDVKVYVPNHYEVAVQVVSSAFIGDVRFLDREEGGIFSNVNVQSPRYAEADKKIKLVVSTFIGDTRVTKVG
jgi:Predicted membrane protein